FAKWTAVAAAAAAWPRRPRRRRATSRTRTEVGLHFAASTVRQSSRGNLSVILRKKLSPHGAPGMDQIIRRTQRDVCGDFWSAAEVLRSLGTRRIARPQLTPVSKLHNI